MLRAPYIPPLLSRLAVAALVGALGLTACTNSERPTVAEWTPKWDAIVAVIPDQADLGIDPDEALCESTLALLRSDAEQLLPTPDVATDEPVRTWIEIAEEAFFDCPPSGDSNIGSFADAYEELERLESEIDVALGTGS